MPYNGLDSDLKTLAKFVFIYETRIKTMNRADDFLTLSTESARIFKSELQPKIKYATKEEISNQTDFTKRNLFFTKSKVQIIDFCRHLRNSFGHALLFKQEIRPAALVISDKTHGKFTCKGALNYTQVKNFLIYIIRDYEESMQN